MALASCEDTRWVARRARQRQPCSCNSILAVLDGVTRDSFGPQSFRQLGSKLYEIARNCSLAGKIDCTYLVNIPRSSYVAHEVVVQQQLLNRLVGRCLYMMPSSQDLENGDMSSMPLTIY